VDLNYSTINLFPVPIHIFDVNGFNEIKNQLIDYAYDLKKKNSKGVVISNRGGWQSTSFAFKNKDDILQSFIAKCLGKFPAIHQAIDLNVDAWININPPGAYNVKHSHAGNDLSGVLWIKCSENCGNIEFDNPSAFQTYREIDSYADDFKERNNIYPAYYFPPTEGRTLVFPSYLQHKVEENQSDEDRISVSFNIRLNRSKEYDRLIQIAKDHVKNTVLETIW
tara:strand:+ start:56 stop:724 length:669 start_codon:yes stop_codon:yes gene_type:complete